jgi:multidrug transporter EmrE-like cation transporter
VDWLILSVADGFECCWAVGLKYTEGFTKLWPSMFTIVIMGISLWLAVYIIIKSFSLKYKLLVKINQTAYKLYANV